MNSPASRGTQRGYDAVTFNHYLSYRNLCLECTPDEFQRLFENIIKRAYPEFAQVRPYGNIGDRKCDGLFISDGTIFQVYSPHELTQAALIAKINEDLDGAVSHWGSSMKTWVFVYNDRRGLPPDVPRGLQDKQLQFPGLMLESMSGHTLWEMARGLSLQQRCEVLGPPNGYESLFLGADATGADIADAIENGWFVIVHDTMSPISIKSVIEAMKSDKPFGAPIRVRPEVGAAPWTEAAEFQREILLDTIEKSRDLIPRFAVFSLSQIALAIHLGFVLSDRLDVRCFQFDRDRRTWAWPDINGMPQPTITVTGMPARVRNAACEVVVRVSLSANISKSATIDAVGNIPVQIDLSVPEPSVMWLKSPEQLLSIAKVFRETLADLRVTVPNCSRIHLFYAGPTGGAVVIGQQINPRMNPPVRLYEYSRQSVPAHQHVLTLDNQS